MKCIVLVVLPFLLSTSYLIQNKLTKFKDEYHRWAWRAFHHQLAWRAFHCCPKPLSAAMLISALERLHVPNFNRICTILRRTKSEKIQLSNPSAALYPVKGECCDNKPIKVKLEAGKDYSWCACGLSGQQPWCDGSHKAVGITTSRPVKFTVKTSGDFHMCNCKATDTRPLCDGTHKKLPVPRRYKGVPQLNRFDESPVYVGVCHKLGYRPKEGRWHF